MKKYWFLVAAFGVNFGCSTAPGGKSSLANNQMDFKYRCSNPSSDYGKKDYPGAITVAFDSKTKIVNIALEDRELTRWAGEQSVRFLQSPLFDDCSDTKDRCLLEDKAAGALKITPKRIEHNIGRYEFGFTLDFSTGLFEILWSGAPTGKNWYFKTCQRII
jgi:hypothetical protein